MYIYDSNSVDKRIDYEISVDIHGTSILLCTRNSPMTHFGSGEYFTLKLHRVFERCATSSQDHSATIQKEIQFRIAEMSVEKLITISPSTNKPILERNGLTDQDLADLPATATEAFKSFQKTTLAERQAIVRNALKGLDKRKDELAEELTEQMGRPISYTAKEISTAIARAEYLLKVSDEALKDTDGESERGFKRYIRKVAVGPVLILFAWNVGLQMLS